MHTMQAEIHSSLCSLAAEKHQMIIQMQAENALMEKVYSDLIAEIKEKRSRRQIFLTRQSLLLLLMLEDSYIIII